MLVYGIITAVSLWGLAVCSACCAAFVYILRGESYEKNDRHLQTAIILFYIAFFGKFVSAILYYWYPSAYAWLSPALLLFYAYSAPFFYRIVFILTSRTQKEVFPRLHFIAPAIFPAVMLVWYFFVPNSVREAIVSAYGAFVDDYPVYSRLFTSLVITELVFTCIYMTLSVRRLLRYRKGLGRARLRDANYRLRWLINITILYVVIWIPFLTSLWIPKRTILTMWLVPLWAVMIAAFELMLLYNTLRHNYPRLEMKMQTRRRLLYKKTLVPDAAATQIPTFSSPIPSKGGVRNSLNNITKKMFDDFMRREKPYLDPGLQLTTLAEEIGVTREELSRFVNRTYGMNFNVLVGRWRLRELERISRTKAGQSTTLKDRIAAAGFGSYHSYMRACERERPAGAGEAVRQDGAVLSAGTGRSAGRSAGRGERRGRRGAVGSPKRVAQLAVAVDESIAADGE